MGGISGSPFGKKKKDGDQKAKEASPQPVKQRVIRVFVSSTFRDMQAERDELVLRVFPQLRKICEQRSVVWGEVDLRWGITEEQSTKGKVLPICLEEIRTCRPYFIGLLGERYGWVPDEIDPELIEQEPWLKEHLNHSYTELEILHGVLRNPDMAEHAYFYFRDPAYIESIEGGEPGDFIEGPTDDEIEKFSKDEAQKRADERRKKLVALKERIRGTDFPVEENYKKPKALGELILRDFTALIDKLFPEDEIPDQLDRDALEHEAFAASRFGVYIGRKEYFDRLNEHAKGDGPPLVILGESGSGKSALLANWAREWRAKNPDEHFIMHFIGATPQSASWAAMLRRIMGEFKRRFDIPGDIPDKPEELRQTFKNWLYMTSAAAGKESKKIVLILDALNQLEDREGAPDLVWLPPVVPENIRLILSTLPGRPLDALKKREWPTIEIQPLDNAERKKLIAEYLVQYRKKLSDKRVERLASSEQTQNPLYLRALLEELRVFGAHYELDDRIDHYLEAKTIDDLYEKILERYEKDYEDERPGLVRDAMTAIWASRRGLSETELLEILGKDNEPLPQAYWAPLYLAAEHSLVVRSGLINFFHDYMKKAVEDLYLPTSDSKKSTHIHLADYFTPADDITPDKLSHRTIDEYPWQLSEGEKWQRLYDLLADIWFFERAWRQDEFDVKRYWTKIQDSSALRISAAYRSIIDNPKTIKVENIILHLSFILEDTGSIDEALKLRAFLSERFRELGDPAGLSASLGNQALILKAKGDLDGAMKLLKDQERICRELGDPAGLQACLGNQAVILQSKGDLDGAMKLLKEQERICRELGDPAGLQACLGNQALILKAKGDLDGAMALHKEEERICRELGDPAGLSRSLGNQALILQSKGDLDGAMKLHKEEERICRELGDPAGLSRSLGNQALILRRKGDLDGAMKLHKEEERICRELGDPNSLAISLVNQALIINEKGDTKQAFELAEQAYQLANQYGLIALAGQIKPSLDHIRSKFNEK